MNVKWGNYGIHGTNKPWSIGQRQSGGCIRMLNKDVIDLYSRVDVGTPVKIIGEVSETTEWVSLNRARRKRMAGSDSSEETC